MKSPRYPIPVLPPPQDLTTAAAVAAAERKLSVSGKQHLYHNNAAHEQNRNINNIMNSVVTVSKFSPVVGFGRF